MVAEEHKPRKRAGDCSPNSHRHKPRRCLRKGRKGASPKRVIGIGWAQSPVFFTKQMLLQRRCAATNGVNRKNGNDDGRRCHQDQRSRGKKDGGGQVDTHGKEEHVERTKREQGRHQTPS